MIRDCGRTDFQQVYPEKLFNSITQKLYAYSDTTLVYLGHDYLGRTASFIMEEKSFDSRIDSRQTLLNFVQDINNLVLPKPKRIDEAVPQNMKCGNSLGLGHINEDNFTRHDHYKLLDKLNPTESVIDVWMPSEYHQWHVLGSLNISIGNEKVFIDKICRYDRVFLHCHPRRRVQKGYFILSMQGLENLACINGSGKTDWHQAYFPVEQ